MSDGRADEEITSRIAQAGAVMQQLGRSVVRRAGLSREAKLSIYRSVFAPVLTYGHEVWVLTERIRSRVQAAEMRYLRGHMSLYPEVGSGQVPGAPPSYSEAVGGVYATAPPMGFYPPSISAQQNPYNTSGAEIPKGQNSEEPPIVTAVVPLGPNSTRTICPKCNSSISTMTKTQPGVIAYVSGALIAIFGCWLGCCLIPCCIEDCMDIHHSCPECKTYLGSYKRL